MQEFLNRIGEEGRSNLIDRFLNGYKTLISNYRKDSPKISQLAFLSNLDDLFNSDFHRQLKVNLMTIDKPVLERFESSYMDMIFTLNSADNS
jgi:hypothetical protein